MSGWQERVQAYKDEFKDNPWNPYAPQTKRGYDLLATHENLACVLCPGLTKAINIVDGAIVVNTDGSIDIGCDFKFQGGYRKISLIPNAKVTGGATMSRKSEYQCPRNLIKAK